MPVENIFSTLQTQLGSLYVNDLNLYGRTFRVIAQADARFRADPEDVGRTAHPLAPPGLPCRSAP